MSGLNETAAALDQLVRALSLTGRARNEVAGGGLGATAGTHNGGKHQ